MNTVPMFFVPASTEGNMEERYAELAKLAQSTVPKNGKRIYSLTFKSKHEEWVATVGEKLNGKKDEYDRKGRRLAVYERTLSDEAVVLAIFSGYPYTIVTTQGLMGRSHSVFANPISTNEVVSVVWFADSESAAN